MNFAVIGAKGFIGQHLVTGLSAEGHRVHAYSSQGPGPFDSETGVFDPNFSLPANLDAVFYLSQSPFYRQASLSLQHVYNVNTLGAAAAAKAAKNAAAKMFVYASTGNVYAPSFLPMAEKSTLNLRDSYALSKIHAEQLLKLESENLKVLCVRLFGVFGSQQSDMLVSKIKNRIISEQPIAIEKNPTDMSDMGGIRVSYLYVSDLIRILYALVTSNKVEKFECLNVAGPRAPSLRELALTLASKIGKEPIFNYTEKARQTDLIADISSLLKLVSLPFSSFDSSIQSIVESEPSKIYEFRDGGHS